MNVDEILTVHRILDWAESENGYISQGNIEVLRRNLPERPKPKTLEEVRSEVSDAWEITVGNSWDNYEEVCSLSLEAWLGILRNDLTEIIQAQEEALSYPALPEGMRLAEHEELGRVVVSPDKDRDGDYAVFFLMDNDAWGAYLRYAKSSDLTFIDTEPARPAHPEFLETAEDYRSAPGHTVVSQQGDHPWVKLNDGTWITTGMDEMDEPSTDVGMSRVRRRVLRWGLGE